MRTLNLRVGKLLCNGPWSCKARDKGLNPIQDPNTGSLLFIGVVLLGNEDLTVSFNIYKNITEIAIF
jgi:hypothetical protein